MQSNELKIQFDELMHEIIIMNGKIAKEGDYRNLFRLCNRDITIISLIDETENLTAKAISEQLNIPKTTVITAVSRLVSRGYIERIQNESDKREMFLGLTDKGRQANKEHKDFENIFLDYLVSRWNKQQQDTLAEVLRQRRSL